MKLFQVVCFMQPCDHGWQGPPVKIPPLQYCNESKDRPEHLLNYTGQTLHLLIYWDTALTHVHSLTICSNISLAKAVSFHQDHNGV